MSATHSRRGGSIDGAISLDKRIGEKLAAFAGNQSAEICAFVQPGLCEPIKYLDTTIGLQPIGSIFKQVLGGAQLSFECGRIVAWKFGN